MSGSFVASLPPALQNEVTGVYTDALRVVWYASMGLSVAAFALVFLEKEVVMRTTLEAPEMDGSKDATKDSESKSGEGSAQPSV